MPQHRQHIGAAVAVGVVGGAGLDQHARLAGHAVFLQQRVQHGRFDQEIGGHEQAAAVCKVAAQRFDIGGAKVGLRRVEDEGGGVLRHGAGRQVEFLHRDARIGQRLGEIGAEGGLAMAGQLINDIGGLPRDLGDAGREGVFGGKAHAERAGRVVACIVVFIEVGGINDGVFVAADQDDAAAGRVLRVVLCGKGRVDGRVALLPAEAAALPGVAVKQVGDVLVLAAGLGQIVGRDVLAEAVQHVPGRLAQRVQAAGRDVELGVSGRDGPHDKVQKDDGGQHDHPQRAGVGPRLQRAAAAGALGLGGLGGGAFVLVEFHGSSLPRISSSGAVRAPGRSGTETAP